MRVSIWLNVCRSSRNLQCVMCVTPHSSLHVKIRHISPSPEGTSAVSSIPTILRLHPSASYGPCEEPFSIFKQVQWILNSCCDILLWWGLTIVKTSAMQIFIGIAIAVIDILTSFARKNRPYRMHRFTLGWALLCSLTNWCVFSSVEFTHKQLNIRNLLAREFNAVSPTTLVAYYA